MATEKQIAANRANTQKSTGSVTASGKQNSARNATHHGILAKTIVLPGESQYAFNQPEEQLTAVYEPITPIESLLVESMISTIWRQRRI